MKVNTGNWAVDVGVISVELANSLHNSEFIGGILSVACVLLDCVEHLIEVKLHILLQKGNLSLDG